MLSLYMFVIGYIETVDKIARKDLSGEITQIQEWFRNFTTGMVILKLLY